MHKAEGGTTVRSDFFKLTKKNQEEDQDAEVAELLTAGENKVKSIDVPEEVVDLEEFSH